MWRAARIPPYLYFMPVPRPVLSRRAPAGPGGRGTTAARALGPDPPPPGGSHAPRRPARRYRPRGGRGPHRRSSLLRLRRFCSVHAMNTCMPAGQGRGGAPRGGREGVPSGKLEGDTRGCSGASPGRAGRLREVAAGAARRIGPARAGCWRSRGLRRRGETRGRHEWSG